MPKGAQLTFFIWLTQEGGDSGLSSSRWDVVLLGPHPRGRVSLPDLSPALPLP